MSNIRRTPRTTRTTQQSKLLRDDVAAMIADADTLYPEDRQELAHQIIVVVRERVLAELASYARENIR